MGRGWLQRQDSLRVFTDAPPVGAGADSRGLDMADRQPIYRYKCTSFVITSVSVCSLHGFSLVGFADRSTPDVLQPGPSWPSPTRRAMRLKSDISQPPFLVTVFHGAVAFDAGLLEATQADAASGGTFNPGPADGSQATGGELALIAVEICFAGFIEVEHASADCLGLWMLYMQCELAVHNNPALAISQSSGSCCSGVLSHEAEDGAYNHGHPCSDDHTKL